MDKLIVIAGPCVVEDLITCNTVAAELVRFAERLPIKPIFKASYKKANRTDVHAFSGIGDIKALQIIKQIGDKYGLMTTTDIHTPNEAPMAAPYVDVIQIPAFLCRQTELIEAAASTQKIVNIKKGQFANIDMMSGAIDKVHEHQIRHQIFITERGTTFGYDDLVIDMRNVVRLSQIENVKCIVDLTHSLGKYDGDSEMIMALGRCAVAAGAHGVFIEVHPTPSIAKSDGKRMLPLVDLEYVLRNILKVWTAIAR